MSKKRTIYFSLNIERNINEIYVVNKRCREWVLGSALLLLIYHFLISTQLSYEIHDSVNVQYKQSQHRRNFDD